MADTSTPDLTDADLERPEHPDLEQDVILAVTDSAVEQVLGLRAAEDDADGLGLRVEITGTAGVEFTYDLSFEPVADADPAAGDSVVDQGGLPVIVPAAS